MYEEQLIAEALSLPTNSIAYVVSQRLAEHFTDKTLVEGDSYLFDIEEYAQAQHCQTRHLIISFYVAASKRIFA